MSYVYEGSELDLFAAARNWKTYVARELAPFIGGLVLEVGAGIGSNVPYLWSPRVDEWLCLEPDEAMARRIADRVAGGELPSNCRVRASGIAGLPAEPGFDTILYLDVLEHIADDAAEVAAAMRRLNPGGRLIVLGPAHHYLFSPFDAAIGHYRRYDRKSLLRLTPAGSRVVACRMLDCVGFFASLANRLVLKASMPSPAQIAFWDKGLVPVSRLLDGWLAYRFGKSILGVWSRQKDAPD